MWHLGDSHGGDVVKRLWLWVFVHGEKELESTMVIFGKN